MITSIQNGFCPWVVGCRARCESSLVTPRLFTLRRRRSTAENARKKILYFCTHFVRTNVTFLIISSILYCTTGWTVRGSNPGGGEIFRSRSDRSWDPPSLLYNGYRVSFPGVKRPGRGASHPIPSWCRGLRTGRVISVLPLLGPQGPLWAETLPLPILHEMNNIKIIAVYLTLELLEYCLFPAFPNKIELSRKIIYFHALRPRPQILFLTSTHAVELF
jgi:hypothetical protein